MKTYRKALAVIIAVLMLLPMIQLPAFAAGDTYTSAEADYSNVLVNGEIKIYVSNADMTVASIAGGVLFDSEYLEVVKIDLINDAFETSTVEEANDAENAGYYIAGSKDKDYAAGDIVVVTFKALKEGSTSVMMFESWSTVDDGNDTDDYNVIEIFITHEHDLTKTEAVAATCKEAGNIAYWTCSICGEKFSDAEGKTTVEDVTVPIDPDAHQWGEWVVTKEPTVEADGEKTRTCTLCGETKTEKVPFHCDHEDMQHVEAKEANCTEAGNIEYWKCDNCKRFFSDEKGENEITEDSTVIPADPDKHTWGEPTYECNEDHTVGTAKHTCEICGKEETEEVTPIVENIPATCEKPSFIKITAKFTKDGFEEQSCMEEGEEEALGHDYSAAPVFTWSSDYKTAKAVFTCKRDATHTKEVAATVTSETEDNETTYTAKVTVDGKTYTDTKTVSEQVRPQPNPKDNIIYIPRINGGISKNTKDVRPTREPDPVPGTKTAAAPAPVAEPAIPQVVNELPFIDVFVTDAYYDAVKFVYDNGLFMGVSDKEFDPSGTMTRAMFVTVLGRLAKVDVSAYTESSFTDVEPIGTWNYAPYVEWAAQNGIVLGYGDGRFGPNDLITKEQAAVIIARYAKCAGVDTSSINTLAGYADCEAVSDWAFDAVAWADDVNIYVLENGLLNPQAPASRAVVAMMLCAYVK